MFVNIGRVREKSKDFIHLHQLMTKMYLTETSIIVLLRKMKREDIFFIIRIMKRICKKEKSPYIRRVDAWRSGRVVECARLEIVYPPWRIWGSNPHFSANERFEQRLFLLTKKRIKMEDRVWIRISRMMGIR